MVSNRTMLTFLFLLAFLPSYPLPAIKTFAPLFLFSCIVFFQLFYCKLKIPIIFLYIFMFSLSGVFISSLVGGGDLSAIAKELIRASSLIVFLFLIGGVVTVNTTKLIKALWFIIVFNFVLVLLQFNELEFTLIYTQANAEMPFFRPSGVMGNPNLTAFFISCLLILFSFEERFSRRLFAVIISIATGLLMQSRSGLLLIGLSTFYVLSFGGGSRRFIVSAIFLAITLFVVNAIFFGGGGDSFLGAKLSYLTSTFNSNELNDISSVALRMELWSSALSKMSSVIFGGAIYEETLVVDSEFIYAYTHRGIYGLLIYFFIFSFVYFKISPNVRGRWLFLSFMIIVCSVQAETISSVLHSSIIGISLLIMNARQDKHENEFINGN